MIRTAIIAGLTLASTAAHAQTAPSAEFCAGYNAAVAKTRQNAAHNESLSGRSLGKSTDIVGRTVDIMLASVWWYVVPLEIDCTGTGKMRDPLDAMPEWARTVWEKK